MGLFFAGIQFGLGLMALSLGLAVVITAVYLLYVLCRCLPSVVYELFIEPFVSLGGVLRKHVGEWAEWAYWGLLGVGVFAAAWNIGLYFAGV